MNRRRFLKLAFKGAVATGLAGTGLAAVDVFGCVVTRKEIPLAGLSPAFDGYRVALLSDFHHSWWITENHIRRAVAQTNRLQPDLIALTGDYIHRGKEWVPGLASALSGLKARDGVVGVLGNHDHYQSAQSVVRDGLRQADVFDLTNRGFALHRGGESLTIAGTGDYWREKQNLHAALGSVRRRQSVLLLQHNPDYVEKITDDRVGLVLSGHTHGGQCVFPFIGAPILPSKYGQKYVSGLCQGPVAQVYVTTGVGSAFPPVRLGCPAEIALLTLRKA